MGLNQETERLISGETPGIDIFTKLNISGPLKLSELYELKSTISKNDWKLLKEAIGLPSRRHLPQIKQ